MKNREVDLLIIGAGPAGLAAAVEAKKNGLESVLLVERNEEAGGILQQCIHDGFGLHRFGEALSGPQYAQRFIDEVKQLGVEMLLNTMVIELRGDRTAIAVNEGDGVLYIRARAIILAMGCRERSRMQAFLMGARPKGVLTAGTVQRYLNVEGVCPGKRAVVLGSGDIGLIMARRMTLEGIEVEGVYEKMPNPGGLRRNVFQCLDDYGIPLHLSTTVTQIHGKFALEGVTVQEFDAEQKPIEGTKRYIPCDLLVLSVGLIPENELSKQAGVPMNARTRGPVLDNHMMSEKEGFFAAGNVGCVFDLVDHVSDTGERAAQGVLHYLQQGASTERKTEIVAGEGVHVLLPTRYRSLEHPLRLYARSKRIFGACRICIRQGDRILYQKNAPAILPQEMLSIDVPNCQADGTPIVLSIVEKEETDA